MPNPSQREVCTKTSARPSQSRISVRPGRSPPPRGRALPPAPAAGPPAARAEDRQPRRRDSCSRRGERPQQGLVVLLRDQAADGQQRAGRRRDAGRLGRRNGRRRGQLVEAVVDRDSFRASWPASGKTRTASEIAISAAPAARRRGRRTGTARADSGRRCARRDVGSESRGGDRAVDVCVHEVRVQQVGLLGAHRADDVARHPRAETSSAAADAPVRDAGLLEALVEARRVRTPHVEPEEARVDARARAAPAAARGGGPRSR